MVSEPFEKHGTFRTGVHLYYLKGTCCPNQPKKFRSVGPSVCWAGDLWELESPHPRSLHIVYIYISMNMYINIYIYMLHVYEYVYLEHSLDGRNPANQLRVVVYLIIYKVLYIPGGCWMDFWTINSMYFNFACICAYTMANLSNLDKENDLRQLSMYSFQAWHKRPAEGAGKHRF